MLEDASGRLVDHRLFRIRLSLGITTRLGQDDGALFVAGLGINHLGFTLGELAEAHRFDDPVGLQADG